MIKKFKVGDRVICKKNIHVIHKYDYCSSTKYFRDKNEKGKILTISKIVNRFGKQFLYFNEYKPKKITIDHVTNNLITEKVFPLDSSRFEFFSCCRQEELDI